MSAGVGVTWRTHSPGSSPANVSVASTSVLSGKLFVRSMASALRAASRWNAPWPVRLSADGEAPQRRLGERLARGAPLVGRGGDRPVGEVRLHQQHLGADALEPD